MIKVCLVLGAIVSIAVAPSPIADAAMKGDLAQLRALIAKGADVNAAQGDGMTALHWAAERGDSAMTAVLLSARASVRARTRIGDYIPLHIAARNGKAAVVVQLLKAGSDVKALTPSGATPLHLAAASGNPVVVKALADRGADVNAREHEWGQTPLVFAASYGRADAIRVLLKAGADPSLQTRTISLTEQEAAEQAATRKRNAVLISFEPEKHRDTAKAATVEVSGVTVGVAPADTARPDRPREPTPIGPFTASQIQEAIDSGRAVLLAGNSGKGPVTEVVDTINGGVAGYVASVGGVGGLTPLHHAVRQGHAEATMALLQGGADINARTGVDSTTPLLLAAINGHFDLAAELLKLGGDPNIANTFGLAPLYAVINTEWRPRSRFPQPHAAEFQRATHLQLMEALLKAGAQPNVRIKKHFWYFAYNNCGNGNCGLENLEGTTPFWRAVYSVDLDAMKMLARYGADVKIPSQRAPEPPTPPGAERRGRRQRTPPVAATPEIDSAGKAAPAGVGVYPIHAAAGVGYGNGFAGNSHRHAPDGWMPAMKYLVEELGADVNERDAGGYTPLHHAAARGDNEMILYLVSRGADPKAVSRDFRTTIDMANGPVQRLRPFAETIALLEKLGAKNSHRCVSC